MVIQLEHANKQARQRRLARFAAQARRAIGLRGEVHIRITSSRKMQVLNRGFRRKNTATDVLSFPAAMLNVAGDIAISAEIAAANAAQLGHPMETELKILILHGMLHLAGYDHETDDGEMLARETDLRRQLHLPLALIERAYSKGAGNDGFSGRQGRTT